MTMSAKPTSEARAETCWFIERGTGEWWTPEVRMGWTPNASMAVRFSRKQDADAVILGRDRDSSMWRDCDPFASEHVFLAPPHPAAPADAGDAPKLYRIACAWCGKDIATKVSREDGLQLSRFHFANCPEQQEAARRLLDAPPVPPSIYETIENIIGKANMDVARHQVWDEGNQSSTATILRAIKNMRERATNATPLPDLPEAIERPDGSVDYPAPPGVGESAEAFRTKLCESLGRELVMRKALEYIAHFDRAALDGAATLHYDMNGVARKALDEAALAAPAPAEAATRAMSPEEAEAQRRSFAYGNSKIDNDGMTREIVDAAAESMKPAEAARAMAGECETCAELHDLLTKAIEVIDDEGLDDTAARLRDAMRATMRAAAAGSVATGEGGT